MTPIYVNWTDDALQLFRYVKPMMRRKHSGIFLTVRHRQESMQPMRLSYRRYLSAAVYNIPIRIINIKLSLKIVDELKKYAIILIVL